MTHRCCFHVVLTVRSPFLFRGLDASAFGVDVTSMRDETGRPIIPGDQVRGVLKDALCDLMAEDRSFTKTDIDKIYGSASNAEEQILASNDPMRGIIAFGDLVADGMLDDPDVAPGDVTAANWRPLPTTTLETSRIAIDTQTGAVKTGALQVLELVAPFGAAVRFVGEIVYSGAETEAKLWCDRLGKALHLTSAIGSVKSSGYGEVLHSWSSVTWESATSLALTAPRLRSRADRIQLRVTFDRPVLVEGVKLAENAIKGSAEIPGAAIKGALANRLANAGENPETGILGDVLAKLLISHALPESDQPGEAYGLPIPLSVAAVRSDVGGRSDGERKIVFRDLLGSPRNQPQLIDGLVPRFVTDWKDDWFEEALHWLDRPAGEEPPLLTRTHTAIDRDRGVADDEKLFTTLARSVLRTTSKDLAGENAIPFRDRTWLMTVDATVANAIDKDWADKLVELLVDNALDGIGKTQARAMFATHDIQPDAPSAVRWCDEHYALMLVTPAVLFGPEDLKGGAAWPDPLTVYGQYFRSVSEDLELVDCFASQHLAGGYVSRRRRAYGPDRYYPYFLTMPGSVFFFCSRQTSRV